MKYFVGALSRDELVSRLREAFGISGTPQRPQNTKSISGRRGASGALPSVPVRWGSVGARS